MCPNGRPVGRSAKRCKRSVDIPGGRLAGVGRRNRAFCEPDLWPRQVDGVAMEQEGQGGDEWSSRSWGSLGPAGECLLCKNKRVWDAGAWECVAPPC